MSSYVRVPGLWDNFRRMVAAIPSDPDPENEVMDLRLLVEPILEVYDVAIACGGFLAGGMPRYMASREVGAVTSPQEQRTTAHRQRKMSPAVALKEYLFQRGGDMDFFFPDKERYEAALALTQVKLAYISENRKIKDAGYIGPFVYQFKDSMCNNATNLKFGYLHSGNPVKVQFIKCRFGDVIDTLEDFDLVNSRVAVVGDDLVMDSSWLDLEKEQTLMLDRVNSPFCVGRIKKYVKRHGYTRLTPESRKIMIDRVLETYEELASSPKSAELMDPLHPGRNHTITYNHDNFAWDVQQLLDILERSDIQRLMDIYTTKDMGSNLQREILKRLNKKDAPPPPYIDEELGKYDDLVMDFDFKTVKV